MSSFRIVRAGIQFSFTRMSSNSKSSPTTNSGIPIIGRTNENVSQQKARLLYQSRKRGMLENGLLLSTFADEYLDSLTSKLTNQYDQLINEPSNDWDIYYWLIGKNVPPKEFENEVFHMLKEHTKNRFLKHRFRQPELRF